MGSAGLSAKINIDNPLLSATSHAGSSKFGIFSRLAKNEEQGENKISHISKYNVK